MKNLNVKKKVLITVDLNGVLGYAQPLKNAIKENALFPDLKPHSVENGFNFYRRPSLEDLYNVMIYEKKNDYDFGVWANQSKENTALQINNFFGIARYNLKFVLFTPRKYPHQNSIDPEPIERDLKLIFDKHPEYDESNTVVISNYPNKLEEYRDNDIIIPKYHPSEGSTYFTMDAHMYFIYEYFLVLNSLKSNSTGSIGFDIRELMKQLRYDRYIKIRAGSTSPDKFKWDHSNFVNF